MRTTTLPTLALVLLLGLTACLPDGADEELEARVAELEQDLAEAEQENETLAAQLEQERQAEDPEAPDEPDDPDEPGPEPEPIRTPEGLVDQFRARALAADDAELPEGHEPGTTEWEEFDLPADVDGTYETPGDAVFELARALDAAQLGLDSWESTVRVLLDQEDEDAAEAAVLSWGFADDSVVGRDVRVTLQRTEEDAWTLGSAQQRSHCLRGVDEEQQLCL